MARVVLRAVEKRFGAVAAVTGLDLEIPDGAFATFLGPSGCGKTTTLRMVAGLERPSGGTVAIGDAVVSGNGIFVAPEARAIGMVFQSYAVWPHLTVFENVAFPLRVRRVARDELRARVDKALATVRLEQLAARYPAQMSGGQQQRIALARAIVFEPRLLLLDEPLSNLDARLRQEMRSELRELQQRLGLTALYVTHDQEEALAMSDLVFVMDRGRLQQTGRPRDINERPANRMVADFLGWGNLLDATVTAGGVAFLGTEIACAVPPPLAAGAKATLAVRPHDIALRPGTGGLTGKIASVLYMADRFDVRVRVGDTVLAAAASDDAGLAVGTRVTVRIDAARVRVLPA